MADLALSTSRPPLCDFVEAIVRGCGEHHRSIWQLGYVSRLAWQATNENAERNLFLLGSMGSVVPFAMGLASVVEGLVVNAIEGDGSILMNFGCLFSAYAAKLKSPLNIFVIANGVYESCGGQPIAAPPEQLQAVIGRLGLECSDIRQPAQIPRALRTGPARARVAIVHASPAAVAGRISKSPDALSRAFADGLNPHDTASKSTFQRLDLR